MAIVINVPRDERFGNIGRGIGRGIAQGQKSARLRTMLTDAGVKVPDGAGLDEMELAIKLAATKRKGAVRAGKVDPKTRKISDVGSFTQQEIDEGDLTPLDEFRLNVDSSGKATQTDRDRLDFITNNPHLDNIDPAKQRTVARNVLTNLPKELAAFERSFSETQNLLGEKDFKLSAFDELLTTKLRGGDEKAPELSFRDAALAAKKEVNTLWEAEQGKSDVPLPTEEDEGFDFQGMFDSIRGFVGGTDEGAAATPAAVDDQQAAFSAKAEARFGVPIQPNDVVVGQIAEGVPITLPKNMAQMIFDGDADILDGAAYLTQVFDIAPEVAAAMINQNRIKLNTAGQ